MRVLLIEPRSCWIGLNIALAYLAAALKQAGIEVKVLDLANHRQWDQEQMVRKMIESYKPDLIGIALFYISYYQAKEMVETIKNCSDIPVVIGGPQMLIEQKQIMHDMPGLDYAVIGDGEKTIVELCEAINGQRDPADIENLMYRNNGQIVRNKDRELDMDIDRLPFPDYEPFGLEQITTYSILTSRGCPYHCTYCFRSTPKWRPRSPENIIEELKLAVEKYKTKEFAIMDDSFNAIPQRVEDFCDLLEESGMNLKWRCAGVRADKLSDSLAKRMRQAGCYAINIGVETLDPDLYKVLDRRMLMEDVINGIKILKKHNFHTLTYCMMGIPGDTKERTWGTFKKLRALGVDYPKFSLLLPFPGTRMHEIVYSVPGVKEVADYRRISTAWTNDPEFSKAMVSFETPEYTAKEKIEMYNKLRTLVGDPRPPYNKSMFIFGLHALWWVFKYDNIFHAPVTLFRLARNFLKRFIRNRGRHVYMMNNIYKQSFLREMQTRHGED
jgi:radical SAM superfamily enzyme YgiQ (UPF0313 family)